MIHKVLILGSGGLRVGQAGEFDYSGSQAIKALKEEGIKTVLVNPNIATIQTDKGLADEVYLEPLNISTVTKIIAKEKPDGILLGFGGQTALNLGLALEEKGVLNKYGVKVLGTPTKAIRLTEDRDLFKKELEKINVDTPKSFAVTTVVDALKAAKKLKYPIMMRSGFSLGGLGSGKISSEEELKERASASLHGAPQILIEEYLGGWKEIEYEIVRDKFDNAITVCNMENFDPMGIHTGESIVVAPSQTLTNKEYHLLREVAIKVARAVGIVGECNIQYALNLKTGEYRVIEMNARLSRSSALASKATGYPLAFVAAKLALGKKLYELKNAVTKKTSAFFEPALDYLVVKIPRWDLTKFKAIDRRIGSEMKSVGEVMGIGRSFPEALQKAVRMLNIGASGLSDYPFEIPNLEKEISEATDRRLFAVYQALRKGASVERIHELSKIDKWFLSHLKTIADFEKKIKSSPVISTGRHSGEKSLSKRRDRDLPLGASSTSLDARNDKLREILLNAKMLGFGDKTLAKLTKTTEQKIRSLRLKHNIKPVIKQIDTLSGEFPAETNYLYTTYQGTENDIKPSKPAATLIIGSGPYCIGSSVEFDWCAVNTARSLRKAGVPTIIVNSNPETVSTDYDESDRLYFEELTLERVQDIAEFEGVKGIIASVGGQIANNLALPLENNGWKLLGTGGASIDMAEDRNKFSALLEKLKIDQPEWCEATNLTKAEAFATKFGYPVLVRPSYVLSGAAMNVVYSKEELEGYVNEAALVSPDHPLVVSKFILNAKELEIDGVAQNGKVVIYAISEHVENAGVHSGDATIVLPPQRLYLETIRRAKRISRQIASALKINGPFNIQFIAKDNALRVIECNLRASRSFPFVSKVTGYNFIDIATEVIQKTFVPQSFKTLELDYVGVKMPQFSYQRLRGADPIARVEMASTGEVACLADNYPEAFFKAWLATEQTIAGKRILLSIGGDNKLKLLPAIQALEEAGWDITATHHTHEFLSNHGIATTFLYKASDGREPGVLAAIANKEIDLIINIPRGRGADNTTDGYKIRRLAVEHHIPLITNLQFAELFLKCLEEFTPKNTTPFSWSSFISPHLSS